MTNDDHQAVPVNVVEELANWLNDHQADLAGRGWQVDLRRSPEDGRDKRSAWLVLDSTDRLSELIVWDTGETELHWTDVTSEVIQQEHRDLTSRFDLDEAMAKLVTWLSGRDRV